MTQDRISWLGFLTVLTSLSVLPFVVLRANRVENGIPVGIVSWLGWWIAVPVVFLIVLSLLLFLKRNSRPLNQLTALFASFFMILLVAMTAGVFGTSGSVRLISPAGGFWLGLTGFYLVIFGCLRKLPENGISRLIPLMLFLAGVLALFYSGSLEKLSLVREYRSRSNVFFAALGEHAVLTFLSVLFGMIAGFPLGVLAFRGHQTEKAVFFIINLFQTIPALSILGLLIAPLSALSSAYPFLKQIGLGGVGWMPALIVLFLYSLLPIAGNVLAGLRSIQPEITEAAKGMGMTGISMLVRVELPLAFPIILSGVRTALTQNFGNAILAGLIGGGGLGSLIFLGLAQAAPDLILLGSLPVIVLALVSETMAGRFQRPSSGISI